MRMTVNGDNKKEKPGISAGGLRIVLNYFSTLWKIPLGNQYSPTVIIAAITSKPKAKLPTHVAIPADIKGLEKDSVVLLEQLRTLDKRRLDGYIGTLDRRQMLKIDEALCSSTGLRKMDKPIVMCLCSVCAKPFYDSEEHFIKRADKNQSSKEICMFCNIRQGYDYLIRKNH